MAACAPQIDPACDSGCSLLQACCSLAFTLACHTCGSSLSLACPGQESLTHHSTATYPCSCLFVCVRCPPTHSFCLRWQIIVAYDTADADKCAVRLLQPFFFAYALFACGCFSPCVWLFSPTEHLILCFPQHPLYSSSVVNLLCVSLRCSGIRKVTNLYLLACDLEYMDCFHLNRW